MKRFLGMQKNVSDDVRTWLNLVDVVFEAKKYVTDRIIEQLWIYGAFNDFYQDEEISFLNSRVTVSKNNLPTLTDSDKQDFEEVCMKCYDVRQVKIEDIKVNETSIAYCIKLNISRPW